MNDTVKTALLNTILDGQERQKTLLRYGRAITILLVINTALLGQFLLLD